MYIERYMCQIKGLKPVNGLTGGMVLWLYAGERREQGGSKKKSLTFCYMVIYFIFTCLAIF